MNFVIDRTQDDIDQKTEKGYINASDLVRVESNTEQIAGCVAVPATVYKAWTVGDLPRVSDYERIIGNVERIRNGYVVLPDTPETPTQPLNTWQKWNAIERILHDIFGIYDSNLKNRNYCGEISAGEEIGVI